MSPWFEKKFENPNVSRRSYKVQRGISSTMPYTYILIIINVIAFLSVLILGFSAFNCEQNICSRVALNTSDIIAGQNLWTFITSMFIHAGLGHLMVNMISLLFIGTFVEKLVGKKRFLYLYFGSGLFAGIFFVLIAYLTGTDLNVYAVGASGAIFGLGGLLAILTPRLPVLVFLIIPMPMWLAMIFLMFGLWAISLGLGLPIGNIAHLGGLIVGVIYGLYLKQKYPRKAKMISSYFSR